MPERRLHQSVRAFARLYSGPRYRFLRRLEYSTGNTNQSNHFRTARGVDTGTA